MSKAYQQILSLLPGVTSEERRKLKVLVSALKGSKEPSPTNSETVQKGSQERYQSGNVSPNGDWLLEGMIQELSRRGLVYRRQQIVIIKNQTPNYDDDAVFIRNHLEQCLKRSIPQPRKVQLEALGKTSARSLAEHMQHIASKAPLGLKLLMNNVGKTLEALDNSFPGYVGSGMIGVLIQRNAMETLR